MHRWLTAKGLPSPQTALATAAALEAMRRPAILKPREGTGGWNFRTVRDPAELADVDPSRWLLQELLQQPQVALDTFHGRGTGSFRAVCRESLERRGSIPTKVRIYDDPALAGIAERVARALPLFGAFIVEIMRDAAGRWQIHDVNPRVGGGTRMCAAVGLDFAAANLADFWGEPTDALLPPLRGEHYVVRQYADYVTSRSGGD